jgi:mRNA interferase RelE/StbE
VDLRYLHEFLVELDGLDAKVRRQIRRKLDQMHRTPVDELPHEALRGRQFKGLYKLRVGDWRLIYKMEGTTALFVTLGHRSEAYR